MIKKILFFLLLPCLALAQPQPTRVLMNLSAHPDDEDGATQAYYTKLFGVKTYSVFYTRGEGGQNEIGTELYDDLGVLRTRETLAAGAIQGSDVLFLNCKDFGFSKTAKETFQMWGGKDAVLARVVYAIRRLRPDVIMTNHDTITVKPNRQHGNHQAVGITAYEAFEKAADPTYHAEQLTNGVTTWQVKKLFFRAFRGATGPSVVELNGEQKTPDGKTVNEIAIAALAKHRTQGMDKINFATIPPWFRKRQYVLGRSDKAYPFSATDLFSGIEQEARTVMYDGLQADAIFATPLGSSGQAALNDVKPETMQPFIPKNVRIGLVKTYDDTVEETLKKFRIPYTLLDSSALATTDFSRFTTLVLDLRAYFYRTDLVRYNDRVLKFAADGGNVVVFYHKTGDWNRDKFAPYPIEITSERVTEETAAVQVLEPTSPLLKNISAEDWNGWVQERSLYLPASDTGKTSARYARLLAMSDEDETQPPTSLLAARTGKGTYVYCSLALYRQIKILNTGGLKLFFNLIGQPRG
jgi:LmbE family N-acetylglucosaminyl deacetylase